MIAGCRKLITAYRWVFDKATSDRPLTETTRKDVGVYMYVERQQTKKIAPVARMQYWSTLSLATVSKLDETELRLH